MKRQPVHKSISILLAAMLLALALVPAAGASAQDPRLKNTREPGQPAGSLSSIRYVKPGAGGGCSGWADACELQTALGAAFSGDQIWAAEGIYYPGPSGVVTYTFRLKSGVALYGGFAGTEASLEERDWTEHLTILSGDIDGDGTLAGNAYHVVTSAGVTTTAVLDGFTITGGNANGSDSLHRWGGGMYNDGSSPTLTNVIFNGNTATSSGGGMFNYNYSSPTLTDVSFNGNTAAVAGGMYNYR